LYNVVITLILLPFVNTFADILNKIWVDKSVISEYKVKYINPSLFGSPTLAISMAKQETLRIGKKIFLDSMWRREGKYFVSELLYL